MANIDRSEIAAVVGAALMVFAPAIHRLGIDSWVNLDLTNVTTLIAAAVLLAAYLLHRSPKAA